MQKSEEWIKECGRHEQWKISNIKDNEVMLFGQNDATRGKHST